MGVRWARESVGEEVYVAAPLRPVLHAITVTASALPGLPGHTHVLRFRQHGILRKSAWNTTTYSSMLPVQPVQL